MLNLAVMRVVLPRKVGVHGALWPGSWNQPIADRQYTQHRTQQKALKGVKKMCVSKDIWMCLLSAAIGGIISFLLLKFWNSPRTEATIRPKIPVEHDERER